MAEMTATRSTEQAPRVLRGSGAGLHRWTAIAVFALLLGLAAWLLLRPSDDDALARARHTGTIRIGYAVEAPYAFLAPDGRVTGESPEIARLITTRLGIPHIEWRLTEFDDLLDGLESGRFDVIAAGMFQTPERQRRVAFSRPTFQVGPGLLVRKGNPLGLRSYADAARSSTARVAVVSGSDEEVRLLRLGCPTARLIRVPDANAGRAAVRSGEADALALSAPTLRWMATHPIAGLTEMVDSLVDAVGDGSAATALGGFVFRREDHRLREAWDAELASFVGSDEHRRLVGAFGFTSAELPPLAAATTKGPQP